MDKALVAVLKLDSKEFGGSLDSLQKGVIGFASAAGAALIAATKHTADYRDATLDASRAIGVNVKDLSALQHAAKLSGVETETLQKAMKNLVAPTGQTAETLKNLGINTKDANGRFRDATSILGDVADATKRMGTDTDKAALSMAVFGDKGAAMVGITREGSAGLKEMMQQAELLGLTFDEKAAEAAATYNDNIDTLTQSVNGLSFAVGDLMIEMSNESGIMEAASGAVQTGTKFIKDHKEEIKGVIDAVVTFSGVGVIGKLIAGFDKLAALGTSLGGSLKPIKEFFSSAADLAIPKINIPDDIPRQVLVKIVNPFLEWVAKMKTIFGDILPFTIKTWLEGAKDQVTGWAQGISAVVKNALDPRSSKTAAEVWAEHVGNMNTAIMAKIEKFNKDTLEASEKAAQEESEARLAIYDKELKERAKKTKQAADGDGGGSYSAGASKTHQANPIADFGKSFKSMVEAITAKEKDWATFFGTLKDLTQAVGQQVVQVLQAAAQLAEAKLAKLRRTMDFGAKGLIFLEDQRIKTVLAGLDAELAAVQAQKDELLKQEEEYQKRMEEIRLKYAEDRKKELDDELKAEFDRLDSKYARELALIEGRNLSEMEKEAAKADLLIQLQEQKNQLLAQSDDKLKEDIEAKNRELETEKKARAEAEKKRQDELAAKAIELEKKKTEAQEASAKKKEELEKAKALLEWSAGKNVFEAQKKLQTAQVVVGALLGAQTIAQGVSMLVAQMGVPGLIAGAAFAATTGALLLYTTNAALSAINSSQYPPPPVFDDGGMSRGRAMGDGWQARSGDELHIPMFNPGKDFGALKEEVAKQLVPKGGNWVLNIYNTFGGRDDYEKIKQKLSLDLRDMVRAATA